MTIWDRLTQLLQRPARRGVRGDIGMENAARGVLHHDQDIEQAKGGCDHDTEITGDDRPGMVADKGPPALGRATVSPPTIQTRGEILPHGPG